MIRDHISASQPEPRRLDSGIGSGVLESVDDERTVNGLCFSQPVHPDHMLLSTQMQCTPGASQVTLFCLLYTVNFSVVPHHFSPVDKKSLIVVNCWLVWCRLKQANDKVKACQAISSQSARRSQFVTVHYTLPRT